LLGILFLVFIAGCGMAEEVSDVQERATYVHENILDGLYENINSLDDLSLLITEMSPAEIVLLGESTHGTQEYYEYRRYISQELIENYGFDFIVVEGDWNSIYTLNEYVRGEGEFNSAKEVLATFNRWPEWMWANDEIERLAEWLRVYNEGREKNDMIGIYGLDVYDAESALVFLHDSELLDDDTYACLLPFRNDLVEYAQYLSQGGISCEAEVVSAFNEINGRFDVLNDVSYLSLVQNARVVMNAEKHYRGMLYQGPISWNERVYHMVATIQFLREVIGERAIIWAHNTHVGDARATPMAQQGMVNMGHLLRENDSLVYALGFGTYVGEVVAGRQWGGRMEVMSVPPAIVGSYEHLFMLEGMDKALFLFSSEHENYNTLHETLSPRGHRAIGVVYNPLNEQGNYVMTDIMRRYDAFIFMNRTSALTVS
ncbi:MAG: erythromycin esterase family protein, partial [Candidatus Woesearchaeota archaeon]